MATLYEPKYHPHSPQPNVLAKVWCTKCAKPGSSICGKSGSATSVKNRSLQSSIQQKDKDKNNVKLCGQQYTPYDNKIPTSLYNQNNHVPTPDVRSSVMRRSNLNRLKAIAFHGNTNLTLAIRRIQRLHTRLIRTGSAPTGNIPNCNRTANTILSIKTRSVGGHLTMAYTNKRFSQNNSRGKLTSG